MNSNKEKRKSILRKGAGFAFVYVVVKWLIIGTVGILFYRSGHWSNWYLLVIPIIGLMILGIRKYREEGLRK